MKIEIKDAKPIEETCFVWLSMEDGEVILNSRYFGRTRCECVVTKEMELEVYNTGNLSPNIIQQ